MRNIVAVYRAPGAPEILDERGHPFQQRGGGERPEDHRAAGEFVIPVADFSGWADTGPDAVGRGRPEIGVAKLLLAAPGDSHGLAHRRGKPRRLESRFHPHLPAESAPQKGWMHGHPVLGQPGDLRRPGAVEEGVLAGNVQIHGIPLVVGHGGEGLHLRVRPQGRGEGALQRSVGLPGGLDGIPG